MALYAEVGRQVREMMRELTPLVEPLSIDEAFLDLTGTERLHGASPALTLARFARRVEEEIGITVSVGLSYNKFLAKIASRSEQAARFLDHRAGGGAGFSSRETGRNLAGYRQRCRRTGWRVRVFA